MIRVSIIIPCFNQAEYLPVTVQSARKQSYDQLEIVIVNDGSSDTTSDIAKELLHTDSRIRLIETPNQGLPAARNNGIEKARGTYILPLDADDLIHPEYVEKAVSVLSNHPEVKVVYGEAEMFGLEAGRWELPPFSMETLLKRNLIYSTALFRKIDFEKAGGYDPEMKYGWEDWDLWLRMLRSQSDVYKIPETLFYYRIKESSMVLDIEADTEKRRYLEQKMVSKHVDLYLQYFPEPLTLLRELENLREANNQLDRYKKEIRGSWSYKIGDLLLRPLKSGRNLLQNKTPNHPDRV